MTKSTITIPKFQSWRFLVFYAVMAVYFRILCDPVV